MLGAHTELVGTAHPKRVHRPTALTFELHKSEIRIQNIGQRIQKSEKTFGEEMVARTTGCALCLTRGTPIAGANRRATIRRPSPLTLA